MKYFRAELPDIPCYWHGVRYPSIEMRAKSKKQVLAFLLKKNGCLYLYEEYLPCIDEIVKEIPDPKEKQLSLF